MTPRQPTAPGPRGTGRRRGLSAREREIVGFLADGMSGAEIAAKLFLSPETIRTHIRNAMTKLGASTRSQAVVLALQQGEVVGDVRRGHLPKGPRSGAGQTGMRRRTPKIDRALQDMLAGLCRLHEIEAALILLAEEDGLTLNRVAVAVDDDSLAPDVPERLALGEGPLGRVALNRRAALLPGLTDDPAESGTVLAAPILSNGHLLGVLGLTVRSSRPTAQGELLILQALVKRVGEILTSGEKINRRLQTTVDRFRASWSATIH